MQRKELIVLFAALLVGLLFRLYLFSGMVCADDTRHAFHGYFLFSEPGVKYADITRDVENRNVRVAYSRIGVNLPVWITTHVFGVHGWSIAMVPLAASLAGIVFVSLLARRIAGATAGMLAGVVWACLPLDIYYATVLLQDDIFASLFALYLLLIATAEHRAERSVFWCLFAAGLVVGYLQYVKESAPMLLGVTGLWAGYKCIALRRIQWRFLLIPLGWLVMQALAGWLFWHERGDAFWYWKSMYAAVSRGATVWYSFTGVVGAYVRAVVEWWQFGYLFIIFPLAFVASMLDRNTKIRLLIVMLWVGQLVSIYLPSRSTPNLRYLLQISPLYVLGIAVGLAWLLHRLPSWGRRVATPIVFALVVWASLSGFGMEHQRYRRPLGDGHRHVYRALMAHAAISGSDQRVYVTSSLPIRTQHALYQLNGYKKLLGGFAPLGAAYDASEGWVVLSTIDRSFRQEAFPRIPDNWIEVYCHRYSRGNFRAGYTSLFKILPRRQQPEQLSVFPADGCITLDSFKVAEASGVEWRPIDLGQSAETYAFSANNTPVTMERVEQGLRCEVGGAGAPGAKLSGGMRLPVSAMKAFRCRMGFADPKNILTIHVTGFSRRDKILMSWAWRVHPLQLPRSEPATFTFVPGEDGGLFKFSGNAERVDQVAWIGISVRLREIGTTQWTLEEAEVGVSPETELLGQANSN